VGSFWRQASQSTRGTRNTLRGALKWYLYMYLVSLYNVVLRVRSGYLNVGPESEGDLELLCVQHKAHCKRCKQCKHLYMYNSFVGHRLYT
jgi:hypothetical protein